MKKRTDIPFSSDSSKFFIPWLSMFMVFIATLILAIAIVVYSSVQSWTSNISGTLTVQIPTYTDKGESREKQIIQDYKKNPEGCELLIVVDKLLTGFDAPRDTVLYLAKQLKDHNLLQAIARVNRVFDGDANKQSKTAGLIVDYSKNAKNLKNALELFSNYAPEDIENALLDTESQIALLKNIYTRLHDVLKNVTDINNSNAYVEFLADKAHENRRQDHG